MTNQLAVSVLIPSFNQAAHIQHVVECVNEQSKSPDEIIVVDDASTDNSAEIIEKLPVKLIKHEKNQGPAITRNTALHNAKGEIVIFIDSDAYADTHLIETFLAEYQNPSNNAVAGVGGRGIEANIKNIYDRWRSLHARQDFGKKPRQDVPYLFGLCMSFRRDVLLEVGGFDTFYPLNAGEDLDLGYRLRNAGYSLRYTPDAIIYHQHSDTEERLMRVQYNWYFWSFLAKKRHHDHPWTLFAGTLRRLFTDTFPDVVNRKDLRLALLDMEIFVIKMKALKAATRVNLKA